MKFKYYFTLVLVLTLLLSLACVVAGENVTGDLSVTDDASVGLESTDSQDVLSSDSDVDLCVNLSVEPSYVDGKYNPVGSEVPWNITVEAKGSTVHNAYVQCVLSSNLGYVTHHATVGEYDRVSGIWNIGNLNSSDVATLIIWTKLNRQGTYVTKAYALTDSQDADLMNNFKLLSIKTGSSKSTSNITETSDDRVKPNHDIDYELMLNNRLEEEKKKSNPGGGGGLNLNSGSGNGHGANGNSNSKSGSESNGNYNNIVKEYSGYNVNSFIKMVINSNSTINSTSNIKSSLLNIFVGAVQIYDYLKVPIVIFALFLLAVFALIGYDKVIK